MARFCTFSRAGGPGVLLGSGQGARTVEGLLIKGDPMFKERPMLLKTLALMMAVENDLQGCGSSLSSPPPAW